jgi:hypothetical protein
MFLINKPALFFRSIHYWSAQIFLITSAFHVIDHMLKKTETTLKTSTWFGLIFVIPVIIYAMFGGFLLKADYDSVQALNIIISVFNSIPYIGKIMSDLFIGNGTSYQIIYIHHILTATLIIWLITIEHSKKILPSGRNLMQLFPLIILLSILLIPAISNHTYFIPKGPWYLAGMQEILHWFSNPLFLVISIFAILILFFSIKYLSPRYTSKAKYLISIFSILYILISIIALFFRGESWTFILPWKNDPSVFHFIESQHFKSSADSIFSKDIPLIQGKIESCMYCHSGVTGLSNSHDITTIGCYACHLGEPLSTEKSIAHKGMTLTPGNLDIADRTCGQSNCHSGIIKRVNKSLMTTMSGVVAVDKYVFDEAKYPDGYYHIDKIAFSPAETHLRGLCAGCHLSNNKLHPSPVDELSRGGGCSACHLKYNDNAKSELHFLQNKQKINPRFHPAIDINMTNENCFGCHSRSGRISTNYEGWHETHHTEADFVKLNKRNFRLLQDGRVFEKQTDDVHHKAGMGCIDCHNSYEVMGDGISHTHKENAVKIRCYDCHTNKPNTITYKSMDAESQKILVLKNKTDNSVKYIQSHESKIPYLNSTYLSTEITTELKENGKKLTVKPPTGLCGKDIQGHSRLDCISCHTSWAPQCIGCHTQYDSKSKGYDNLKNVETNGAWFEKERDFHSGFPTLGVTDQGNGKSKITTFVPGMVLTIDKNKKTIFKRLYAPIFSHTIQRNASTCKTCHNNPQTIGYGKGVLSYSISGKWTFKPQYELNKYDQLPEDAWIGFMQNPAKINSTRTNTRPFTLEEQKRILLVGSCFTCHSEKQKNVLIALKSIKNIEKNISKKCILPTY